MSIERTSPLTGSETQRRWMQTNAAIIEAAEEGASIGAQEIHTSVDGAGLERIFREHKNIGRTYHLGNVADEAEMLALDSPFASHACLPGDTCFRTDTQQIMRCISNYGASLTDWEVVPGSGDPSGTASSAVSAHNSATDSHADLRTALGAKQDALTISTVGTALLNIAEPSSAKLPRINSDSSVTLIDVSSGGGLTVSEDGPPATQVERVWSSNGDANGVFRSLGAESGTWANPAVGGRIRALASSLFSGTAALLTDRATTNTTTNDVANSWFAFDLGAGTSIALDSYTLQGRGEYSNHQIRTWSIEGSNDVSEWTVAGVAAATWTSLDSRSSDATITGAGVWGHWATAARSVPFRFIRILQTGANSSGAYYLGLSEVELYGLLSTPVALPSWATGWLTDGTHYVPGVW